MFTSSPAPMVSMESLGTTCDGVPLKPGGGTWKGHVIPGAWFLGWGLYWAQACIRAHIRSKNSGRQYMSKPWYPLMLGGGWIFWAEPFLKSIAAPIGLSIELYFDSKTGFRKLYCDTGRFSQQYIHNYQHASSYPGFTLSGIVDIIGMFVPLPAGSEQVFLGLSFGVEGFLMLIHKKHLALDAMVHSLLGGLMVSGAAAIFLELRRPDSFPISALRSFTLCMQGIWMITMGEMLFSDSKAWSDDYMGPAMMAPPLFCMLILASGFAWLVLYCCLDWWHRRGIAYHSLPQTVKPDKEEPRQDSRQFEVFSIDDSANETSDDGSETVEKPDKQQQQSRHQLAFALNKFKPGGRQKASPPKSNEHKI